MDYKKHYTLLVERARSRILDGYKERHHVIPRCLGGADTKDNIVELTPEEHYLAHLLLVKMHPGNTKLVFAAKMMTVSSQKQIRNNKAFGWLKRQWSEALSKHMTGKLVGEKNGMYGRSHSAEAIKK